MLTVFGVQFLRNPPSHHGLNWLSDELLSLMGNFDDLKVRTQKSITIPRVHESLIVSYSVVLVLCCVIRYLTSHVAFQFFDP